MICRIARTRHEPGARPRVSPRAEPQGGALLSAACLAAAAAADMARRKRIQSSMRVTVHDVWGRRYQLGFSMDL
jgi:hypothetical protein